jgi:hypothetical protein
MAAVRRSQTTPVQSKAWRIASPLLMSTPSEGSSMCTVWLPWWTAQLKKISAVAAPSRLALSCFSRMSGTRMAATIAKYATIVTALAAAPMRQFMDRLPSGQHDPDCSQGEHGPQRGPSGRTRRRSSHRVMRGLTGTAQDGHWRRWSPLTQHLSHLLMLGAPLLVFAGIFWLEWRTGDPPALPWSARSAALLGGASGVLHGTVVGHHADEAAVLGWFFAAVCVAQVVQAYVLLIAPVRRVVVAGTVGNLGLVVLWAWTRLVGIPFGIAGGRRQVMGWADVTCTLLEVGAVLGGLAWVYSATGGRPPPEVVPWSKWETSTTRNSPPPRSTKVPSGSLPSQETNSLRPPWPPGRSGPPPAPA